MPAHDREDVTKLLTTLDIHQHRFVNSGEMEDDRFASNPPDRCFYCKSTLFDILTNLARAEGYACVLDGSTLDDLADYRPGLRAKEAFQVISPLLEAGLGKKEVRLLSKERGLSTWNKPASPCLSSRIPYGEPITIDALKMIDEAEKGLREMGFRTLRVRKHQETAKIEVTEEEISRLLDPKLRQHITTLFRSLGFQYVTVDLEAFQSGRLNRVIPIQQHPSQPIP